MRLLETLQATSGSELLTSPADTHNVIIFQIRMKPQYYQTKAQ